MHFHSTFMAMTFDPVPAPIIPASLKNAYALSQPFTAGEKHFVNFQIES